MSTRLRVDLFQSLSPVVILSLRQRNLPLQQQAAISLPLRQMLFRQEPASLGGSLFQVRRCELQVVISEEIQNLSLRGWVLRSCFFQNRNACWKPPAMMQRPAKQQQPCLLVSFRKAPNARLFQIA